MGFGKKLAVYRKTHSDEYQNVFARRIGMAPKHYCNIEGEHIPPPKLGTVLLIIAALNLSPQEAADLLWESGRLPVPQNGSTVPQIGLTLEVAEELACRFEDYATQMREAKQLQQ